MEARVHALLNHNHRKVVLGRNDSRKFFHRFGKLLESNNDNKDNYGDDEEDNISAVFKQRLEELVTIKERSNFGH